MLPHPVVQRHVIVLHPATQRMQQQERVLEILLEALARVLQEQAVAVVKRVPHLECVQSITLLFLHHFRNLRRQQPILIHAIVPLDPLQKLHLLAGNEPVALLLHT